MSATLEIPDNLCELNLGVMWWVMREPLTYIVIIPIKIRTL